MADNGGNVDGDAEDDEANSGVNGEAGGMGRGVLLALEFAEEEPEAGEGEADGHEAEAGADLGKEGALGGEVGARIVQVAWHGGIVARSGKDEGQADSPAPESC